MGDTFSLKITDKVSYIQHLDRSRYDSTDLFRFNGCHGNESGNICKFVEIRESWQFVVKKSWKFAVISWQLKA